MQVYWSLLDIFLRKQILQDIILPLVIIDASRSILFVNKIYMQDLFDITIFTWLLLPSMLLYTNIIHDKLTFYYDLEKINILLQIINKIKSNV